MIVTIIGVYCIIDAIIGAIAVWSTAIQKTKTVEGAMIKVQFLMVAELALAVWCFK